jgi:DNA methylase
MKTTWNVRIDGKKYAEREREREHVTNAIAGGSAWPAMQQADGKTQRGQESEAGISIFDPTLTELVYRWFSPPTGLVLDPFAGGSVRGIVASKLKRQYVGIELREEQVLANRDQATAICQDPIPVWHCSDSLDIGIPCKDVEADLVFSCPPYADLEVYSDDPKDLSNMPYPQFLSCYKEIIKRTCNLLKPNSFACFVVGEVRSKAKGGGYYGFVPDTIKAFTDAGLAYYNEIILVTSVGSLPIRAGRQFAAGRKIGKTHQNVLVFVKGDPKLAAERCGKIEVDESLLVESGDISTGEQL